MRRRNSYYETAPVHRASVAYGARRGRRPMTHEEYSICNGRQWLRADRLVVLAYLLAALAVLLFALRLAGLAGGAAMAGAVCAAGLGLICAHRAEKMYERRQEFEGDPW